MGNVAASMQRYLLLAVCLLCARTTASAGLLVWYDSMYLPENTIYSNSTSAADLFQFINDKAIAPLGISTLHVQTQGVAGTAGHLSTPSGRMLVQSLIATAAANKQSVSLLFGWSKNYNDPTGWSSVAAATPAALSFCKMVTQLAAELTEQLSITLDIEPDPSDLAQYQQLADLLLAMRTQLDTADLKLPLLSTSSFLFEDRFVSCGKLGTNVSLTQCVAALADTTVLMDFRNKPNGPNGIVQKGMPTLQAASTVGTKAALCLETNMVQPASITFYGSSVKGLSSAMEQARQEIAKSPFAASFGHFVIEDWKGLQQLARGPPPPTPPTPPAPPTPTPPSAMDVILINRAGENLNVKQKLANHSSSEVLCSLKPNDKCSVTTDFIVLG